MTDVKTEILATKIVNQTLDNLAASPTNELTQAGANAMKPEVTKEMAGVITNQLNQEPWTQSTVTITSIGSLVIAVYAFGYAIYQNGLPAPTEFAVHVGAIGFPLGTLYGRWVQRGPLRLT